MRKRSGAAEEEEAGDEEGEAVGEVKRVDDGSSWFCRWSRLERRRNTDGSMSSWSGAAACCSFSGEGLGGI